MSIVTRIDGGAGPAPPCPCGSGLTAAHCCDFDVKAKTPPELASSVVPVVEQAIEAWRVGDRAGAEKLCLEVLERAPDRPGALRLLAEIRQGEGKGAAAVALLRRLTELEPNYFWAINKLTLLLLARGNLAEAERHARNAVRVNPESPQSHNLMGMALTETNRAAAGEYHYRRALELAGERLPMVLTNLAVSVMNQGRLDEARQLYRESNQRAPNVRQTLLGWARLEEADRKFADARARLDDLSRVAPESAAAALIRAVILGREDRHEEAVAALERSAAAKGGELKPVELLERGRLLARLGRYDEAWADFMSGKAGALALGAEPYHEKAARELAERLKRFFTRSRLALLPRAGVRVDVAQPIFILGFPRSGTTLLEQTLSASPHVAAGDELPLIHDIAAVAARLFDSPLSYPDALAEIWMGDKRDGFDMLRDHYLRKARQMGVPREGERFFTDKMPLNEVHLGLIALLFPKAPLIHMIRHPLDVMVSAMSNFFTHGGFCSSALDSAARHLLLVSDLVEHYRREIDLDYLAVRYEDVVDDQEATVRRVFDFAGVPFDPAALTFEDNRRYARTASYAQVTEKLYARSRYRYRRFRAHLEPVVPLLAPLIERLGYAIEGPD